MVFQHYALFPHRTVAQNVGFGLRMQRVDQAGDRAGGWPRRWRWSSSPATAARYPSQLSGGEQQRVALARALVTRPAVLLLDEPLGALDKKLRDHMKIELKRLQREVGITTIYVTHDQEEALTMSDRIAVMHRGRVEQVAAAARALRDARDRVRGRLHRQHQLCCPAAPRARTRSACGGATLAATGAAPAGATVAVALRPERIRLDPGRRARHRAPDDGRPRGLPGRDGPLHPEVRSRARAAGASSSARCASRPAPACARAGPPRTPA